PPRPLSVPRMQARTAAGALEAISRPPSAEPTSPGAPATLSPSSLALRDAIDEILSGVPSSLPPSVLPEETEAGPPQTPRMLGHLPPPPPPLNVTMPLASGTPAGASREFAETMKEIERAEQPTAPPPAPAPARPGGPPNHDHGLP